MLFPLSGGVIHFLLPKEGIAKIIEKHCFMLSSAFMPKPKKQSHTIMLTCMLFFIPSCELLLMKSEISRGTPLAPWMSVTEWMQQQHVKVGVVFPFPSNFQNYMKPG